MTGNGQTLGDEIGVSICKVYQDFVKNPDSYKTTNQAREDRKETEKNNLENALAKVKAIPEAQWKSLYKKDSLELFSLNKSFSVDNKEVMATFKGVANKQIEYMKAHVSLESCVNKKGAITFYDIADKKMHSPEFDLNSKPSDPDMVIQEVVKPLCDFASNAK